MAEIDLRHAIGLKPEDAIAYFAAKGYRLSGDWHEVWRAAHAQAFTVAHLAKLEVLQDIHGAMRQALAGGKTERWFIDTLTPVLQAKGWWGQAVDQATGEITETYPGTSRPVQYGSPRRLKLIYRTNLQTAYMAGRYKAQRDNATERPYWQYVAVMDSRTRPSHAALNGRVFRHDDPFWASHYPPNGWNCRCRTRALSEARLKAEGLAVQSSAGRVDETEVRIGQDEAGNPIYRPVKRYRYTDRVTGQERYFTPDAGWDYNPGQAGRAHAADLFARKMADADPDIGAEAMAAAIHTLLPDLRADYQAWARQVMVARRQRGELRVVGALTPAALDFLRGKTIEPETAAITLKDAELLHLARDTKSDAGKALAEVLLLQMPDVLARPRAVLWDKQDNAVLYVFDPAGDGRQGKVVVRINYNERSRVEDKRVSMASNAIRSAGLVKIEDLKMDRYETIFGGL